VPQSILRLYPLPSEERALEGTYLEQDLRRAAKARRPWVTANFIASLDGRIAVAVGEGAEPALPENLINRRDWRLFQELAIQADAWLVSGRYLREHAEGATQELLRIYEDPSWRDLIDWRIGRGISHYPALAVLSRRLDFSVPSALRDAGRRMIVFTTQEADHSRVRLLEAQGAEVLPVGQGAIDARRLIRHLAERGHEIVCSTAGPRIAHLLLSQGVLDRLYITLAARTLGGSPFASIIEGGLLTPPVDWRLQSLYFDRHALEGAGQLYACFDRRRKN